MSFHVAVVGAKEPVKQAIAAAANVPDELSRFAIAKVEAVDMASPFTQKMAVQVELTGHFDTNGGSASLKVGRVMLAGQD